MLARIPLYAIMVLKWMSSASRSRVVSGMRARTPQKVMRSPFW